MNLAMCEVPVHPVEHIPDSALASLPVLPMTQAEDGTWYCDGESIQDGTPSPDNPIPITNTYPAGTYKAVFGDKVYKVVLDDDLRSVPGTADRVVIDAGRGRMRVDRKIAVSSINSIDSVEKYSNKVWRTSFGVSDIDVKTRFLCNYGTDTGSENNGDAKLATFGQKSIFWYFGISTDEITTADEVMTKMNALLAETPFVAYYQLEVANTTHSIPTQLVTISTGRSAQILNTVNDKADFLKVQGDSWQMVREKGKNLISNVKTDEIPNNTTLVAYLEANKSYTVSFDSDRDCNVVLQDTYNHKTLCSFNDNVNIGRNSKSFTVTENIENFIFFTSNGLVAKDVQIEEGSTATPYEPYQPAMPSPEYPSEIVSVGGKMVSTNNCLGGKDKLRGNSITLPTLRGLPDGTRDMLYADRKAKRAWVERNVGLVVFDGSEPFVLTGVTGDDYQGFALKSKTYNALIEKHTTMCNIFQYSRNVGILNSCSQENMEYGLRFTVSTGIVPNKTVNELKAYLAQKYSDGEPVIFYYAISEPVIEELPYSDYLLEMCQYETNISFVDCNENLNPKIEVGCKVLGR